MLQSAENMINFESNLAKLATDDIEPTRPVRKAQYTIHKLQRESDLLTPKSPAYPNQVWLLFLHLQPHNLQWFAMIADKLEEIPGPSFCQ